MVVMEYICFVRTILLVAEVVRKTEIGLLGLPGHGCVRVSFGECEDTISFVLSLLFHCSLVVSWFPYIHPA